MQKHLSLTSLILTRYNLIFITFYCLKYLIYILILVCSVNSTVFGQKTTIYTHNLATYNSALELYDKEKFGAAQEKFAQVLKTIDEKKSEVAVNAKYYHAICGLELFNINAEHLLIEFIYAYPESPKVKLAYFHLGRYKFRKKKSSKFLFSIESTMKRKLFFALKRKQLLVFLKVQQFTLILIV